MPTVIKMPQLGESVSEGTIGRWLKQPGDRVERDEPLVEIQTDKVNAEVPSPVAGFLQQILLPEGTTAAVKSDMAVIGDEPVASSSAPVEPAPATFSYDKSAGGGVVGARDDEPASAPAPERMPDAVPEPERVPQPERVPDAVHEPDAKRFYTPVVLRIAEEHNIDLSKVQGTGGQGRVTRRDVERLIGGAAPAPEAPPAPRVERVEAATPVTRTEGAEQRALTPMRRAIADHMTRARADIPDAWSLVEIDVTNLVKHRAALLPEWQAREGYELTYLPFFIKAVLAGLRAAPELNATWSGDHITVHRQYHLGIAVSLNDGLIVPVLRDADQLSVAGVAHALRALVQKARSGKLSPDDLQGATFTVNNPGSLGSVMSQPIVPVGQSGIVTMEAIVKRPIVTQDDAIAVRSMMNSCLSFDHRVLDGAQALRFLKTLRSELETVVYPLY